MTTEQHSLSRRPRTFTVVTVRSPGHKSSVSNKSPSLVIIEKRNQKLIFKDPPLCLEILDFHSRSSRFQEDTHHNKRSRTSKTSRTTTQKPRIARKPSSSGSSQLSRSVRQSGSSDSNQLPISSSQKLKQKINDFSLKRTLEDVSSYSRKFVHLTTDNYHFFGIPRWRKKVTKKPFSSNTMSSETSTTETNTTETTPTSTTDASGEKVVVRVTSDHSGKPKQAQQNGEAQKQDGGLTVPDNTEKKRRSMETLTAKMDFDDEDE